MKIDVFPHCLPRAYFERAIQRSPAGATLQKRMTGIPVLVDVELRLRIMDRYEGYVQVLTLANPPIEVLADARTSPEVARLANDGMAEIVAKHPDRFPAFVASLPMNNPEAAVAEIDRALDRRVGQGQHLHVALVAVHDRQAQLDVDQHGDPRHPLLQRHAGRRHPQHPVEIPARHDVGKDVDLHIV